MTLLLVVTSVLLLLAGVVKLRAADRAGLGLSLIALLEVFAGLALGAASLVMRIPPGMGLAVVVGAVALVVGSSAQMWTVLRRRLRTRDLSEGARLRTYVKYLSSSLDADGSPRGPED